MPTGIADFIHKNDLDKTCSQHDMTYVKYKDLTKRTRSDNVLKDKTFEIASNANYDVYEKGLGSMVYRFLDKKSTGSGVAKFANKSIPNYQLAN